jgi:hypothetical protein
MRQSIILAGLATLVFLTTGCKKDQSSGGLQGVWEIRQAKGMLLVDYPAGNGNLIKFQGNNYEMIDNGQVTQSGTYSIVLDPSVSTETCLVIPAGKYENRIVFNNSLISNKVFFEITGNKLYLISGCFAVDGGVEREYVKQ